MCVTGAARNGRRAVLMGLGATGLAGCVAPGTSGFVAPPLAPLRMQAERLAVNTPFQGTAADMIKMAMLKIDQQIQRQGLKGYMILQIHDELIFEVPDEELEAFKTLVKEAMEHVFALKVPIIVDISVGKNWKEC